MFCFVFASLCFAWLKVLQNVISLQFQSFFPFYLPKPLSSKSSFLICFLCPSSSGSSYVLPKCILLILLLLILLLLLLIRLILLCLLLLLLLLSPWSSSIISLTLLICQSLLKEVLLFGLGQSFICLLSLSFWCLFCLLLALLVVVLLKSKFLCLVVVNFCIFCFCYFLRVCFVFVFFCLGSGQVARRATSLGAKPSLFVMCWLFLFSVLFSKENKGVPPPPPKKNRTFLLVCSLSTLVSPPFDSLSLCLLFLFLLPSFLSFFVSLCSFMLFLARKHDNIHETR